MREGGKSKRERDEREAGGLREVTRGVGGGGGWKT